MTTPTDPDLSPPVKALLDRYKPASFDAAFGVTARQRPPS